MQKVQEYLAVQIVVPAQLLVAAPYKTTNGMNINRQGMEMILPTLFSPSKLQSIQIIVGGVSHFNFLYPHLNRREILSTTHEFLQPFLPYLSGNRLDLHMGQVIWPWSTHWSRHPEWKTCEQLLSSLILWCPSRQPKQMIQTGSSWSHLCPADLLNSTVGRLFLITYVAMGGDWSSSEGSRLVGSNRPR